jgi:translation elongation factor EF-G
MKKCLKCELLKNESEFGKDKYKIDGLNPYCRECIKKRSASQRKNDPEYVKKYANEYRKKNRERLRKESSERFKNNREIYLKKSRESYHKRKIEIAIRRKIQRLNPEKREKDRIRMKKWREKNKERFNLCVRKWQLANRIKTNAHARVHWAVKTGKLKRNEFCEICESKCKTEGHHEDYSMEFDVIWLCRKCHAKKLEKIEV